jgi:hypothetical protein
MSSSVHLPSKYWLMLPKKNIRYVATSKVAMYDRIASQQVHPFLPTWLAATDAVKELRVRTVRKSSETLSLIHPSLHCRSCSRPSRGLLLCEVKSNDRVPMFHDVVRWMLQRDLLVTLHLRVRNVVHATLKARARRRRDEQHDRGWHTEEEGAFQPKPPQA